MADRSAKKPLVTLKIGGTLAEDESQLQSFAADMLDLMSDHQMVVIHGGGAEVSRLSRQMGYEPRFHEGIRLTSAGEMDIVEMVLSGKVNKRLVRLFQSCGLSAVGLCGADGRCFTGRTLGRIDGSETRTGNIGEVDPRLLILLLTADFLPVLSSTSMDGGGRGVNINADTVAFEVACRMKCDYLVFISDIPGVLKGKQVLKSLNRERAKAELAAGTITGGMIPKTTSALEALKRGVGQVIVGQYCGRGSVRALLEGEMGTRFHL